MNKVPLLMKKVPLSQDLTCKSKKVPVERHFKRSVACLVVFAVTWLLGLASVFSVEVFGKVDAFSSNFLLTAGVLLVVLFVGWKMKKEDVRDELTNSGTINRKVFGIFYFLVRYVAPITVITIFITNLVL